ncbi:mitochondrial inner membrane protease subunit 1-like [Amphiura filiformis]|uniref:mitochondrial inner membrane protease subunit 1-like n=1 Tax=Amphiura filiformis TaxID=82378 RepID=UPI003B2205D5
MSAFTNFAKRSLHISVQIAKYGAIIYCTTHCITEYVVDFTRCTGPSMMPTIHNDDVVLTEHISAKFTHKVQRGDIVIFKSPTNPRQFMCKRVVGLELDRVPYNSAWKFIRSSHIPKGHIWVEGDNYSNSSDSRTFGPVPFGLLRGRAVYKVWPVERIGPLPAAPNR